MLNVNSHCFKNTCLRFAVTLDITVEGMKIPKGAHIDIPVYGLTRDPEYWDEPLIIQTAQVRSKPQQVSDR